MSEILERDPVLDRLIDELREPQEDPDKKWAIVWTSWTSGNRRVPVNEWITVNFGEWYGPRMSVKDIVVKYTYLFINGSFRAEPVQDPDEVIHPHDILHVTMLIELEN